MQDMGYVAGVDVGGTSTEIRILSPHGLTISVEKTEGFNVQWGDLKQFINRLKDVTQKIKKEHRLTSISLAVLGVAGARERKIAGEIENLAIKKGLAKQVKVLPDYLVAHYAAFQGNPGIIVISGTGSIIFGSDGKKSKVSGGFGPMIGDPGSGFWIGKETVFFSLCRKENEGQLSAEVKKRLGEGNISSFLRGLDLTTYVQKLSSFAPLTIDYAERGDIFAGEIVTEAIQCLVEMTVETLKGLDFSGSPIVKTSGGLFSSLYFFKRFKELLKERTIEVLVSPSKFPPSYGAAQLALTRLKRL